MTDKKHTTQRTTAVGKTAAPSGAHAHTRQAASASAQKTTIAGVEVRYLAVAAVVLFAFVASYSYAASRSAASSPASALSGTSPAVAAASSDGSAGAGQGAGCACCGGAAGGGVTEKGATTQAGAVQKISVDTTKGYYSPNEIAVKAGVPVEITFTPATGCLQQVVFPDAGVSQDISGGAVIKLPAMKAGEYQFYCGMQMVYGRLVVS